MAPCADAAPLGSNMPSFTDAVCLRRDDLEHLAEDAALPPRGAKKMLDEDTVTDPTQLDHNSKRLPQLSPGTRALYA